MTSRAQIPTPQGLSAYQWRPAHLEDVQALYEMLAAAREIDKRYTPPSEERIQHLFAMLGDQLEKNTLLAFTMDGQVVAEAFIYFPPPDMEHLALLDGNVHIRYRGLGLGSYILSWLEARARQEFSGLDDGLPQLLRASCAAHQSDRIAIFEGRGFQAARYSYKMQRDLRGLLSESKLPSGLGLQPWSLALDPAVLSAFNAAFQGQWGVPHLTPDLWREFFTGVPQFRADLSYLSLAGDKVVGFCINWVTEGSASPEQRQGWVKALGVVPAWRGRGLATALLAHSMDQFQQAGLSQAALDVDAENPTGALRLYQKLGFATVKEEIHFVKKLN